MLSAGVGGTVVGLVMSQKMAPVTREEVLALDPDQVNAFDRSATQNYSDFAVGLSNVSIVSVATGAALVSLMPLLTNKKWRQTAVLATLYAEAFLITQGITGITKPIVGRYRPYLYNPNVALEKKLEKQGYGKRSFFSGHSSLSFCSAVFLSKVVFDMYPKSHWRFLVSGGALTLAAITGYARYAAGKHFGSDILVGAALGSVVGYLVPVMHKKRDVPVSVVPLVHHQLSGIALVGSY